MLLPRILTAIVGIPLLLFLIQWGGLAFAAFVAGIAALSLYEYGMILAIGEKPVQRVVTLVTGTALAACAALAGPLGLVAAASVTLVLLREMASSERSIERAALTLFGAFVLGWMPAHLALLRELRPHGATLTLMLFVSIWVMDTAAYAAGKTFGRHKLAPELSPKKTWEGFIAGFIAAVAVVIGFRLWRPEIASLPRALAVGMLIGVAGQLSDLAESMIKRAVGVKDSGALLPGHGGVMDRFDSFIFGAPAVYYCMVALA